MQDRDELDEIVEELRQISTDANGVIKARYILFERSEADCFRAHLALFDSAYKVESPQS